MSSRGGMPDDTASGDSRRARQSGYRGGVGPAEQPPVTDAMIRPRTTPGSGDDERSDDGPQCHVCGEQNRAASSYCLQCGSKLRNSEPIDDTGHTDDIGHADHHGDPIGDAADEGFWDPDLDDEPWNRSQPADDAHYELEGDDDTTADRPFDHRDPGDTTRLIAWGILGLAALVIIGFTFFRGSDGPEDAATTSTVATDATSQVYGALITELAGDVDALREQAALINERWESDEADYQETLAALEQLSGDMVAVASRMRLAEAPSDLSPENHNRLVTSAGTLETSASDMVEGLKAPDTGEARRTALARFAAAATEYRAVADTLLQVIDLTATTDP